MTIPMNRHIPEDILKQDRRDYETVAEILQKMRDDPEFDKKARDTIRHLIKLKTGILGKRAPTNVLLLRWKKFVKLDVNELEKILLQDGEEGREMRHAHFFANLIPFKPGPDAIPGKNYVTGIPNVSHELGKW